MYTKHLSENSKTKVAAFDPNSDTLYSIKETAALLEVSTRTILRWIADGTLDAFRVGSRWRITANCIAKMLNKEVTQ